MSVIILGSTGSVGTQAINVAEKNNIKVDAIAANTNVDLVEKQARSLGVKACAMSDSDAARSLRIKLADTDIKVYSETDGICRMIEETESQTVINSIIGKAGLLPTLAALDSDKKLALANKESLVVAGKIVIDKAKEKNKKIIPIDSEHCAIHQCLTVGKADEVKNLILTASGGPFFGKKRSDLANVTVKEVLAHPTWNMGAKITVDSATLMNKGFEVIEAMHLFNVPAEKINVVVHRESIIHSMVEYIDNSIIAQMSVPDMRFCIQYAVSYPDKINAVISPLSLVQVGTLSFAAPDTEAFPLLDAAFFAAKKGGAVPAILNASNEVAVDSFLKRKIGFNCITDAVINVVESMAHLSSENSLEAILDADKEARQKTAELINR